MAVLQYGGIIEQVASTATAGGTTTLTNTSAQIQVWTGSANQTIVLPNATTFTAAGAKFEFYNTSTGTLTIETNGAAILATVSPNSSLILKLASNGTSAGTWVEQTGGSGTASGSKNYLSAYTASTASGTANTGNGSFELGSTTGWSLAHSALSSSAPTSTASAGNAFSSSSGGTAATALALTLVTNATETPTATWVSGNSFVTVSSATGIAVGQIVTNPGSGSGFPTGTIFVTQISGTSIYLNKTVTNTQASASNMNFTSATLAGSYSAAVGTLSTSAAVSSTAGDMVISNAFYIDTEDQAKVMTVKFYFENQSAGALTFPGTSSNSFAVWIYDVTNGAWIQPAGVYGMTQSSGTGYCTATFQTTSNSTQYQLAIININATSSASYNIYLDDLSLGPQTAPLGPAMTDWVAYTPTFTNFGTNTGVSFMSRRVGDSLEVVGAFTAGTGSASPVSISLGFAGGNNNVTVDTTKVPPGSVVGTYGFGNSSTTYFGSYVIAPASNSSIVNISEQDSINNITQISNGGFSNGVKNVMTFKVPIVGWSSNVQMSSDTDTRVVAMAATDTVTGGLTSSFTNVTFGTTTKDTHGAFNGTTYTVPVSGFYNVECVLNVVATYTVATTNNTMQILKNGTALKITQVNAGGAEGLMNSYISTTDFYNAGDTIVIQALTTASGPSYKTGTGNYNWLTIGRLGGPSVIAATESVNMRAATTTGTIGTGLATFIWDTKTYDSHGGFNLSTGIYTVPVSGKYSVKAMMRTSAVTLSTTQALTMNITKNGTRTSGSNTIGSGGSNAYSVIGVDTISCVAGDTIAISLSSGVSTSADSTSTYNVFVIERVGN